MMLPAILFASFFCFPHTRAHTHTDTTSAQKKGERGEKGRRGTGGSGGERERARDEREREREKDVIILVLAAYGVKVAGNGLLWCCRSLIYTQVTGSIHALADLTGLTQLYQRDAVHACSCAVVRTTYKILHSQYH